MAIAMHLPDDFHDHLKIGNAKERFDEARTIAERLTAVGVPILKNPDHAAIFTDPPDLVSGPLKELGYVNGWDARCYPSPVDGQDYINVSARLSERSPARMGHWFDYVAVVYPVDDTARRQMLDQGYGNPFIHHLTFGIQPPQRGSTDDLEYAQAVVPFMVEMRRKIQEVVGEPPGTLITAVPQQVKDHDDFEVLSAKWFDGLREDEFQVETMEGGGFLVQFFVLTGGRIEVALRIDTTQTFNPKSVHKISTDEISTVQST